jgi:hypothetical protein
VQVSIQDSFGGGSADTVMHPLVAVALAIAIVMVVFASRKNAVVAFLLIVFLTPAGQNLYIAGVHLYILRIIVPFALARMLWSNSSSRGTPVFAGGLNLIDKLFFCWVIFRVLAVMLLFNFEKASVIYECSFLWDYLGGYILLRFFIQDQDDIEAVAKAFAVVVAVCGFTMFNETLRDQNVFGYLGGVALTPAIREGKIRAQGPFEHAILAGVFAATLVPLFLWLWQSKRSRIYAIVGVIGSTFMVITCASSTPLLAYLAVFLGVGFWPLRRSMRWVRWALVFLLVSAHLAMKAPVWFLIAHVDLVAGNSGYHRAYLIDMFIKHFSEWWLIGTNHAADWGYEMEDLSNQFVAEGETGGLITLVVFIAMISRCFARVGNARRIVQGDSKQEWLFWFLGVSMFSHCVAFFGISYFDQTHVWWFTIITIISVATAPAMAAPKLPEVISEPISKVPKTRRASRETVHVRTAQY